MVFPSIMDMHTFVTAFPALTSLVLRRIKLESLIVPQDFPKGGPALETLRITSQDKDMLVIAQWLSKSTLLPRRLSSLNWQPLPSGYGLENSDMSAFVNTLARAPLRTLDYIIDKLHVNTPCKSGPIIKLDRSN